MRTIQRLTLCVLALALLAAPAAGHLLVHRDANDVQGRLDLKKLDIAQMQLSGRSYLQLRVHTFESFRDSDLDAFAGHVSADIDSRRSRRKDYMIRFGHNTDGLWCEIKSRRGDFAREGTATRGDRELVCTFPRSFLRPDKHPRWRVASSFGSGNFDYAPNGRGWYRH